MFRFSALLLAACLFVPSVANICFADDGKQTPRVSRQEAEQAFVEQLSNVALVGYFSVEGASDRDNKPERYEIRKINKVNESTWMFQTRIKYGQVDATVPLLIPVEWAGDTPMVSLTDFTIPGMGTFTCRVLFYEDRYAGTWQHGENGGHMWGTIEKLPEQQDENTGSRRSREGSKGK